MSTPYTGKRPHYGVSEPEKIHWTVAEVANETGISKGLVFYYSGKLNVGTRLGDKTNTPRRFTKREFELLKEEIANAMTK